MRTPALLIAAVALPLAPVAAQAPTTPKPVVGPKAPAAPDPFARTPFEGADTNKDGKISRAEFIAKRDRHFASFDRNGDGVINKMDLPEPAKPRAAARLDAFIKGADLNHDGSVTREELKKAGTPMFDKVDTNHDGYVTVAEAQAFRQKVATKRQAKP